MKLKSPSFDHTMVPKVIKPTNACGGSNDKAMIMESLSAFKKSSSWQVSTTNKNMGGDGAGLANLYSIVVLVGRSSGGTASGEISL
jgi:hypothetical protein